MSVVDEMLAIFNGDEEVLAHYGMPRRSGRYPWGSGEDPYQHGIDFLGRIEKLKKEGWKETPENIQKEFGMTTTLYRAQKGIARSEVRAYNVARAKSLQEDGLSRTEIGRKMGVNESTVRSWLDEKSEVRMNQARSTADFLRDRINEVGMIDVGSGTERELNVSKQKLTQALSILEAEGYPIYRGGIPQVTNPGNQINQKVICPPGTQHKEIYDYEKVHSVKDYISRDGGDTYEKKFTYPASLDSKRLKVLLADDVNPIDGGKGSDKDGLVQIRRGVEDLSLGESRYSQVRILVDNDKYIKGMAVYSDNMPDGIDVVFNTSKKDISKALKPIEKDKDNPFGSLIKDAEQGGQYWYTDSKTGEKKLGLINKRADEGDWTEWQDALPSQFLSKQSVSMAKKQLDLARADKAAEYDSICSINNPTIKKHMLEKFADQCDSDAVSLKAAALPGQKYHVIIPINTLKDNEVYAPGYKEGTKLALIRYPHGGTFEIPIVTVNNKNKLAKDVIGNDSIDAIGINKNVADRLSGADFDGDTVMCIPTHDSGGKVKVASTPPLKGLEGFDPREEYPEKPGMKYMKDPVTKKDATQMEMGKITNLITDMTIAGAKEDELAAAVRHSMVVIDAGKHKLDYQQSYVDNNISALKKKYQVKVDENGEIKYGGASTIISRAKGEYSVEKRKGEYRINTKDSPLYDPDRPEGAKIWKTADDIYYPDRAYNKAKGTISIKTTSGKKITYSVDDEEAQKLYSTKRVVDENGNVKFTNSTGEIEYRVRTRTQPSTNMAETDDAYSLISQYRHPMELLYADYANSVKAMGNEARLEMLATPKLKYDKGAAKEYEAEVSSLNAKLNTALLNSPKERAAQRRANTIVKEKKEAYSEANNGSNMPKKDVKKQSQQALNKARDEVGAVSRRKRNIFISDREWEAIQKGAISEDKLIKILNNADIDDLRKRATPRQTSYLSDAKINQAKALRASNYTLAEIADKLGVSTSTVSNALKG